MITFNENIDFGYTFSNVGIWDSWNYIMLTKQNEYTDLYWDIFTMKCMGCHRPPLSRKPFEDIEALENSS